jgi:hypothetical protein
LEYSCEEGREESLAGDVGSQLQGHGPKAAITVIKLKKHANHPIMKDMPDGWLTPEGRVV